MNSLAVAIVFGHSFNKRVVIWLVKMHSPLFWEQQPDHQVGSDKMIQGRPVSSKFPVPIKSIVKKSQR